MPEAAVATSVVMPKDYKRSFQMCRVMGHEWQHVPELADHPRYRFVKGLQSECIGCGTVRTRWIHANGRKFGNKYEYPDHYQLSRKKDPTLPRSPKVYEWREQYVRSLGFREEDIDSVIEAVKKSPKVTDIATKKKASAS